MSRPSVYTLIYEKIGSQIDKIKEYLLASATEESRFDRATKFVHFISSSVNKKNDQITKTDVSCCLFSLRIANQNNQ